MRRPAVHHSPDKMACCTFWTGPEYKRLNIKAKDRNTAMTLIKSAYPRARDISVVFYIPLKK